MGIRHFTGFAGVRLEAEVQGRSDAPAVLLVHGPGTSRAMWHDIARELSDAGRQVINLDMRGHGGSEWPGDGRYDFDAMRADLRAVLAQLDRRPVVVTATLGGWVALGALETDAVTLATGLVLVDMPATFDGDSSDMMAARLRDMLAVGAGRPAWDERLIDGFDTRDIGPRLLTAAATVNIPTLYVRASGSQLARREDAVQFIEALPQGEMVDIDQPGLLSAGGQVDAFGGVLVDFLERRAPLAPPEFREGSDARTLRDALGCFATGVTVVTTFDADGKPVGLTANSFTSVSLDPPLLLVCIANSATTLDCFRTNERFGVNVLQIGQQPTSDRFARRGEDRFAETPWETGEYGVPVLTGSLSSFECRRHALHDGGDHVILVGEVLKAGFEPRRDPLLYFRGKYRRLHFA